MALDAYVACLDVIHASWIQNVSPHRVFDVGTARPVAFLTPDIPFRDLLRVYVVIHRMATVASWTRGPLHVVRGIKWFPPIGSFGYKIRTPNVICDVPLGWLGEVVVAKLSEVTLLPNASVDKCHLVFRELRNGIGREVRNDGVLTLAGVPDYVRHWRLLPVFVNLSMTTFARLRSTKCAEPFVVSWCLNSFDVSSRRPRINKTSFQLSSLCSSWGRAQPGIPVSLTPLRMMYRISPSESFCVSGTCRSGTFG